MQYAKNKEVLREAVIYYRDYAHRERQYTIDEMKSLILELKQPYIFNPKTISRISKDLGVDITSESSGKTARKKREDRLAKIAADYDRDLKERQLKKEYVPRYTKKELKRLDRKMKTQEKYVNALVDLFERHTDFGKKPTERKQTKSRKNQTGYKPVVQTRKAYCVPSVKQSYWTKSQKKTTTGKKKK